MKLAACSVGLTEQIAVGLLVYWTVEQKGFQWVEKMASRSAAWKDDVKAFQKVVLLAENLVVEMVASKVSNAAVERVAWTVVTTACGSVAERDGSRVVMMVVLKVAAKDA